MAPAKTERDIITLSFIVQYKDSHHGLYPGTKEVFDHLNTVLPPRVKGNKKLPALVSFEQVHRIVQRLRKDGFLVNTENVPELAGKHRNLIPTEKGIKAAKKK